MTIEKKKPAIRFKGFSGAWEKQKLSELVEVNSGRDYKHLSKGNIPVYGTGGYMLSVNEALSNDKDAIGIGRKGTIDKPYVLKAPFWTVDTLFYAIPTRGNDLDFIYCVFQKINWKQKDESTGVPSLSKIAIHDIPAYITEEKEQTKIGTFFQQLDGLIAQHQQKHDKLLHIKKALLEKIFPKQGETTPAIRFKGFSGAWEEKALKSVAPNISDGDWIESNHIFSSGKYRIIQTGNIGLGYFLDKKENRKYFHQKDFDEIKANEIFPGDILISRLADPAGRTAELPDTGYRMVTAVDVTVIRPSQDFNSSFLKTILNTDAVLKKVNENVSGTSHKRISRTNLEKTQLTVCEINEQTKIGNFFQQLDTLITQHQNQLTKLDTIKQAMLAKMFV